MSDESDFQQTVQNIRQQILLRASVAEDGAMLEEAFTDWAIDLLEERGEVGGGECCACEVPRVGKVSGYWLDVDAGQFTIFVSRYAGMEDIQRLTPSDTSTLLSNASRFITKCRTGWYRGLEESSPGFSFGETVNSINFKEFEIRIIVLTDHLCAKLPDICPEVDGETITWSVWDLQRFHRILTSGRDREEITIDFLKLPHSKGPLPCIRMPGDTGLYETYLAMIPGDLLAFIYKEYGPRLLEKNVRSFLQARGKVNKGIRETILSEPEMFLAYNNGLCATAAHIDIAESNGPLVTIRAITDFQIVNGGQTTASLTSAIKDHADLSKVLVQLKLSVIHDPEHVGIIVGKIARFANSQNKVSEADLLSNDAFHIKLEHLSRTIWAPSRIGANRETKWFYERARGQYNDERGRRRTDAQIRLFESEYPRSQWFTKTDVAKFENTWEQLPHVVSRGAQKNFTEFTIRLNARNGFEPDTSFFQRLVAKAILFRAAEKIVSGLEFGGYRANIVTYSLAWVFHRTAKGIELDQIWSQQDIEKPLAELLCDVAKGVHRIIIDAGGLNVTEYCKREACWERVRAEDLGLSSNCQAVLNEWGQRGNADPSGIAALTADQQKLIERMVALGGETWWAVSKWAKETNTLQGWQRKMAYDFGSTIKRKNTLSMKQAIQAEKIMIEATRLGFKT